MVHDVRHHPRTLVVSRPCTAVGERISFEIARPFTAAHCEGVRGFNDTKRQDETAKGGRTTPAFDIDGTNIMQQTHDEES